ncbi:mastermind-like protein 2 [Caretta caretta]|uniref:mastermind-like protein 2 n=1 Tax=Caretta caretta TaxID=8467 RepID=UPI002095E7A3|nr:mastermind-like protein 2 [Caretta caretta]XP_048699548.1 mastermind-like protein 2 [Caretta caretta]
MGDTAPPQAPDLGAGLLGGGTVAPRVHSAIVERLRARIAVCRQHHQSCEGRYERGRAESSDRERESTLQLLNLVQHGQGARKSGKHSKGAGSAGPAPSAAPPDYHPQLLSNGAAGGRSGIDGEQQQPPGSAAEAGQRNSALIALQGSLKRKLVVNLSPVNNKRPNGISDNSFLDIKRIRVGDNLSMGQGRHVNNCQSQSMSGTLSVGQGSQRKTSNLTNSTHSSGHMFSMPLKEVKKEPGETISCSKHLDDHMSHENIFPNRYGEDTGEQMMDPELQELFNELTNISVPPMSDLELENMINATIKQDEPFNIDLGQQNQRGAARSSLQMEKIVIKSEYSPGLNQAPVGSPQMRPSSTGPAFTMSSAAMSTSSPVPSVPQNQAQPSQVSSVSNRPLTNWQEVSHAQQLKQIAANRQQHALIQQQQQQTQPSSWPTLSPSGPSPGQFVQEKIPSPSFRQQQFSPQSSAMPGVPVNGNQSKAMNNYIYKPNAPTQSSPIDIIMQPKPQDLNRNFINNTQSPLEQRHGNTKPLCHFNSEQTNQQMPSVSGSQSKPSILHYPQQLQSPVAVQQQQQQPTQPLQNQPLQRPPNVSLALQQKMILQKMQQSQQISGLQYPISQQHRQDQHSVIGQGAGPSPRSSTCSNPSTGSGYMNSSQQSTLNQQLMEKKQALQRQMMEQKQQLLLQQQMLAETEKIAPQDQLNRHLTRPPPDYKDQRRNVVSMQQANQYSGGSPAVSMSSNLSLSNPISTHSILSQNSSLLSTPHGTRMPSISAARNMGCYGNIPCNPPSSYNVTSGMNQVQQHRNQNQIITSQNNLMMSRQPALAQGNNVTAFGTGSAVNSQQVRAGLNHGATGIPAQRPSNVMITSSAAAQNWAPPEAATKQQDALKPTGVRFPTSTPYPNQSLQRSIGNPQFPQHAMAPPNQLTTAAQMRPPLNQMNQTINGQPVGSLRGLSVGANQIRQQTVPNLNHPGTSMTPPSSLPSASFTSTNQNSRAYQGTDHGNDLAFDFLNQHGDNIGPALNSDSDFIDSLLKTEPGNDDWMKDINLDEILGNHS